MIEFNVGDLVTFKPYETAHPAKIARVFPPKQYHNGEIDPRQWYELTNAPDGAPIVSICTGASILTSKYYKGA